MIATSNPDIRLRIATESDVTLIFNFIKALAEYEKLSSDVSANEELLRNNLFGNKKFAEVIIAEYKNEPAGFALVLYQGSQLEIKELSSPIHSDTLSRITNLFVKPELRGKGIGKILLAYLGKLAVERDCGRIEWAVLDWNEPSIKFYKQLGAIPMDEWTVFRVTGDNIKNLADLF